MDIIIWVSLGFLGVIVLLVLVNALFRRSRQRAALKDLRNLLISHGMVTATPAEASTQRLPQATTFAGRLRRFLLDHVMITAMPAEDSPQGMPGASTSAGRLKTFLLGGDPGYITVNGMNYDLVTMRVGTTTDWVARFTIWGITIEKHLRSTRSVEFHYIVQSVVADARAVKVRLRTKGGRRSGIVDVAWRGGRLAAILNAQTELNMAIKKCFLPKDSLKLRYDRRNRAVRIVMRVRQKSVTGFFVLPLPTAETMNVINKIAGLVRQDVSGYLS